MEEIIFDETFISQINQLKMKLSVRLHEGMQGGRKSLAKGSSLEFSDFREYGPGDDFRRIDWAAYGRLDKLFIKVFMEEKEAVVHIFLDQSKSMTFGNPSKAKTALHISAALSYIIMSSSDRVNIHLLSRESEKDQVSQISITPSTGKSGFYQLLERLGKTEFFAEEEVCKQILRTQMVSKGVSIIISDFIFAGGLDNLEKTLGYLKYKKQHIILIQVLCMEEREPEETGDFEFIDSETNESVRLTLNPKLIEAYKERLRMHKIALEALARKFGAQLIVVDAESSIENIILRDLYTMMEC